MYATQSETFQQLQAPPLACTLEFADREKKTKKTFLSLGSVPFVSLSFFLHAVFLFQMTSFKTKSNPVFSGFFPSSFPSFVGVV